MLAHGVLLRCWQQKSRQLPTLHKHLVRFSSKVGLTRIGTHSGSFHCDEALACFMLRLTNKFSNSIIVRIRNPLVLDELDAVVDVGGAYEPERDRFDHHQKGFDRVFDHGYATKLSSAGLVYKHYGAEIIARESQMDEHHTDVQKLHTVVYRNFVEAIDAVDNGINQYDTNEPPRYISSTSLAHRIGRLNIDWVDPDQSSERENEAFGEAMELAGHEFLENVKFHAKSWLPARSIIVECLASRNHVDCSGEIMILGRSCPWKLHIHDLEKELKIGPSVKYVLYQDDRSENWRVQAVAVPPDTFESRKPLPLPWRGLVDYELSDVSGIPGCIFVHMSGFIGANRSYEGALAMARASLKM